MLIFALDVAPLSFFRRLVPGLLTLVTLFGRWQMMARQKLLSVHIHSRIEQVQARL
jgi:hypothetical protein